MINTQLCKLRGMAVSVWRHHASCHIQHHQQLVNRTPTVCVFPNGSHAAAAAAVIGGQIVCVFRTVPLVCFLKCTSRYYRVHALGKRGRRVRCTLSVRCQNSSLVNYFRNSEAKNVERKERLHRRPSEPILINYWSGVSYIHTHGVVPELQRKGLHDTRVER